MTERKYYNPNNFNALHAGVAYLGFWGMQVVLSPIAGVLPDSNLGTWYCMQLILMALGLFGLTAIMSAAAKTNPFNGGGFLARKSCSTDYLMAIVLAFGTASLNIPLAEYFASMGDSIAANLPSIGGGGASVDIPENALGGMLLYMFVLTPLLPAIFEELLFRGVIMRGLLQYGKIPAVVLSALMFALAHGSYMQLITQFLTGLVIGFLVLETKNLVVGMAVHFANNFFASWGVIPQAYVMGLAETGMSADKASAYLGVIGIMNCLIGAACLIAGLIYFGKRVMRSVRVPERSRGDVRAAFIVEDPVMGYPLEESPWYCCGALLPAGERRRFVSGRTAARMNTRSGFVSSVIVLAIGLVLAIAMFVMSFFVL